MQNIKQFKLDFISANMVDIIKKDYEVIMIWIAGSTLTGLAEEHSDYDLGVLIADDIDTTKYKRNDDFLIYKPEHRRVQWMYETVADITTQQPNFKLRNIGWAQFINITEDYILYKNPAYISFITDLIAKKREIAYYSMFLFYCAKQAIWMPIIQSKNIPAECKVRSLYHFCWIFDVLNNMKTDQAFFIPIKHIMDTPVDRKCLIEIYKRIKNIHEYFREHPPVKPTITLVKGANYD